MSRNSKSESPDIWNCLPLHKLPKSWSRIEDSVVLLQRNLYGHPVAGLLWERQFEKVLLKHGWDKIPNRECLFVHREKGLFLSVYVDDIKLAGFGRTNIFLGSCILGLHSKTMPNKHRYCGQLQNHVRIENFHGESRETSIPSKSSYLFMVLWHGLSCKEVCGTILWVSQQDVFNNSIKYLLHASMTTSSQEKKWNLLENCHMYALKLFWNAYNWHELDDLTFYGQQMRSHDPSQNGLRFVTNA